MVVRAEYPVFEPKKNGILLPEYDWTDFYYWWSVRVAERLALPTLDHGVAGSNPAAGEILAEPKRRFIAQSLSCSLFHRLEMTEILLKGRKTLTHLTGVKLDTVLNEPAHEIMARIALRKLNLQTRMRSHPVGLHVWFSVRFFYFYSLWRAWADAQSRLSLRCSPMR